MNACVYIVASFFVRLSHPRPRAQRPAFDLHITRSFRRLAGLAAVGFVAAVGTFGGTGHLATPTQAPVTCQEDDPCWTWRTMGNHAHGICVDGRPVVEWAEDDGTLTHTPGGSAC